MWKRGLFALGTVALFFALAESLLALLGVEPLARERDALAGFSERVRVYELAAERGVYRTRPQAVVHSFHPQEFAALHAYSPLHNTRPGTAYPATLLVTGDHDDRVFPAHSLTFAAALQAAQGCDNPVLIRVEVAGSHGYRPTDKLIAERADQWAFAAHAMGIE